MSGFQEWLCNPNAYKKDDVRAIQCGLHLTGAPYDWFQAKLACPVEDRNV